MDRRHAVELASGASESIPFVWRDAAGLAPPADLWVEAEGRPLLQVSSLGGRPFARAGLDVVALDPGAPYRIVLTRTDDFVSAALLRANEEVMVFSQTRAGAERTATNAVADVVLPGALWRSSVVSDRL
jgi:hypothetical protein